MKTVLKRAGLGSPCIAITTQKLVQATQNKEIPKLEQTVTLGFSQKELVHRTKSAVSMSLPKTFCQLANKEGA